jgi:hypothetical protein
MLIKNSLVLYDLVVKWVSQFNNTTVYFFEPKRQFGNMKKTHDYQKTTKGIFLQTSH